MSRDRAVCFAVIVSLLATLLVHGFGSLPQLIGTIIVSVIAAGLLTETDAFS